jgi:hypothetical protein
MANAGRKKPKPVKAPSPRGLPSSNYFIFGYIGSSIMAIGASLLWILGLHRRLDFLSPDLWEMFWLVGVSILCLGIAITAMGFYGFYINYGSTFGYLSLMILPLCALFFFSIFMYSFFINYDVGRFSTGLGALSIGMILMALSILSVEKYTLTFGLSKVTAIFLFAAAGLTWVIFISEGIGIGWLIMLVACILMTFLFSKIKLPLRNSTQLTTPHPLVRTQNPINQITLKKN